MKRFKQRKKRFSSYRLILLRPANSLAHAGSNSDQLGQRIRYTALSPSPKDRLPLVEELAERLGMPRGIVTDGGKNLREPIGAVKNKGKSLLGLRDVKHLLANALESVVGEGWPYWPVTSIANCDAAGKISERGYLHVRTGNGLKTSGGGTRQGSS